MSGAGTPAPWRFDVTGEAMILWVDARRDDNLIHRHPAAAAALGVWRRAGNTRPTHHP